MNASPLHMRCLSETGPPDWHPAPTEVKQAARKIVELCRSFGTSAPLVALQFALPYPGVASTFVGISSVAEVAENLKALESQADPTLLAEIEAIVAPVQGCTWITGKPENH
ncbi:MAG: aldo/keto reductase [Bryobacteraceae bacterium]